jgi:hypothetical protein
MKATFGIAGCLALSCLAAGAEAPLSLDVNAERGELEIRGKGQKLLVYAFASNQFKPYVSELYTLRGENVLRDAPADHLHHHGLMYAVQVNGVNFWEENIEPGFQRSDKPLKSPLRLPHARFTQMIHWAASTNGPVTEALLVESRSLSLTINEADDEVALTWESNFSVGPASRKIKLHGTDYNGLGLRLPQSFDHVAEFQNSEHAAYTAADSRNVIAGKWSSVTGAIDGGELTVALFGDPGAKCGNHFFTLSDPFAYLSVTQALNKQPLEYAPGEKFQLRYLVLVFSRPKGSEFLNQRYERWKKRLNDSAASRVNP